MQVKEVLEDYLVAIQNHTTRTQHLTEQRVSVFADWCENEQVEVETLTIAHIRKFEQFIRNTPKKLDGKPRASGTVRGFMRCVRAFLNWAAREPEYEELVSTKMINRIEMPKVDQKIIEVFSIEQLEDIWKACNGEDTPALVLRARAIFCVLVQCGVRQAELLGLKLSDVDLFPTTPYLTVMGKGRKQRSLPLNTTARKALRDWIKERNKTVGPEMPYLFTNKDQKRFTGDGLYALLQRLAKRAGITSMRVSAHSYRHTFAYYQLTAKTDVYMLSRSLGHSAVAVTENHYLKAVTEGDIRKGIGLHSVLDSVKTK